jgi:hypothetical protein
MFVGKQSQEPYIPPQSGGYMPPPPGGPYIYIPPDAISCSESTNEMFG